MVHSLIGSLIKGRGSLVLRLQLSTGQILVVEIGPDFKTGPFGIQICSLNR